MSKLLILFIFVSCSSNVKKVTSEFSDEINKEFEHIENTDFNDVPQTLYVEGQDSFPADVNDDDSLARESLVRYPNPKLENIEEESDIIGKTVASCYRKKYQNADDLFNSNFKRFKKNPSYWNQVGTCFFLKGNSRKALLFYNKAISLKSTFSPAINNIGVIYQRNGKHQKALLAFGQASKLSKKSLTPLFNQAQLLLKYGIHKKACETFSLLYKKESDDPDVVFALGTCSLLDKKYKKAATLFDSLSNKHLQRPEIGANFAIALKKVGEKREALKILDRLNTAENASVNQYVAQVRYYVKN